MLPCLPLTSDQLPAHKLRTPSQTIGNIPSVTVLNPASPQPDEASRQLLQSIVATMGDRRLCWRTCQLLRLAGPADESTFQFRRHLVKINARWQGRGYEAISHIERNITRPRDWQELQAFL